MMNSRAIAAALLSTLFLPLTAFATPLTLTFDLGYEDTTITDPTGEFHGPYAWIEAGARLDGFWAQKVGTPAGEYVLGHTHRSDNVYQPNEIAPYGFVAEYTHAFTGDLQGLVISLEDGGTFDLLSIDYDVWFPELPGDATLQRLPWSYAASDPKIIVATGFDPTAADFESQWNAFDAISNLDAPGEGDWHTLDLTGAGLTNLTSIMISQTAAATWLDNIVIDVHDSITPVPEPSSTLLIGLGLALLARGRRGE